MEDSVNILEFAECRAKEIMAVMNDVTQKEPKLTLQKLPYHMRRRAASHNPKRLPRSLRVKVSDEPLAKHKKKSKCHKNLLEEYNSRQKSDLWLSTHIWFAKRFHMKKMWGYQLPYQATGKRFRSSYRATIKSVLLQDLSYFCCIELRGEEKKLLSQLSCLTDESVGMNFASESYIDGTMEGQCFLFHPNTFPFGAIGPVSFLWKPYLDSIPTKNASISSYRHLWIWCHPSVMDELVKVFVEIFQLKENSERSSKQYNFASQVNYMKCKLHFQKEPLYTSTDITMYILKDTLIRHRIIGPNALSVITSIFKPTSPVGQHSQFSEKESVWKFMSDPQFAYLIPIKSVIGATVEDPRLYVTSKEMNILQKGNICEDSIPDEFSKPSTAFSELWDYETRNKVTAAQVSEDILNRERAKYAVPDASDLKKLTTGVPIIVIHQPGVNGYASGWDIIAPQGWGMAFWIPLIYHGAQPAGFDDFCCTNFESGHPTFPLSFPDTEAGSLYEEKHREENLKKFNRYPTAKRPNFKILGVPSPFFMPWKVLVSEWEAEFLNNNSNACDAIKHTHSNDNSFFVLRSRKDLQNLGQFTRKTYNKDDIKNAHSAVVQSVLTIQSQYLKALVLVRVKCLFRGTPTNCSGIYLPSEADLKTLETNPKEFGSIEMKHDIDELSNIPAKKRRKILKEEAKLERKKFDRPEVKAIISSSEHKIIGYVSEGGYSRISGHGCGIGHCTLTGFLTLIELCMKYQCGIIVLIREQHGFQYRQANIEILNHLF